MVDWVGKRENYFQKRYSDDIIDVQYTTHVSNIGWQSRFENGLTAGTTGQSLGIEGIKIEINSKYDGNIQYQTYISNIGWEDQWHSNGEVSGTTGRSLSMEAIKIQLNGNLSQKYDINYCAHVSNIGWMGWAKNGEPAGTEGFSCKIEAIKILVLPKGEEPQKLVEGKAFKSAYGNGLINYKTHIQNIGWQYYSSDGDCSGTTGQSLRLEGIKIKLSDKLVGNVEYRTHVQNIGWENTWHSNGEISGTSGRSLRLEAIQIKLSGQVAKKYNIMYRTHVQNIGWTDWVSNGEVSGSIGQSLRLEGIEIKLVEK